MKISWKEAKYNEEQHVQIERLWSRNKTNPTVRYLRRRFRKMRRLAKAGIDGTRAISIPIEGGEIVTQVNKYGEAVGLRREYEQMTL